MKDLIEVAQLSDKELFTQLVTSDYKGKEYKTIVLEEVKKRAYHKGYMAGIQDSKLN